MESMNTAPLTKETIETHRPEVRRPATFFGTAYHKVSARGNQVAMPRHMLKAINESGEGQVLLVWWNNEQYLRMYTQSEMDRRIEQIQADPELTPEEKVELTRNLSSNAVPIEPDAQGRFVLPSFWVEALNLREEVAFCGVFKRIEIWPAEARRAADRKKSDEQMAKGTAKVTRILNF